MNTNNDSDNSDEEDNTSEQEEEIDQNSNSDVINEYEPSQKQKDEAYAADLNQQLYYARVLFYLKNF